MLAGPLGAQQRLPPCDGANLTSLQQSVIDRETRVPLRNATVTVSWREAGVDQHTEARTDSTGLAVLCVPAHTELGIRALYYRVQSAPLSAILAAAPVHARITTIEAPFVYARGQVLDHANDTPVANATVRLSHTTFTVLTGADGTFVFPRVPVGEYELRIEHPAYAVARTLIQAHRYDLLAVVRVTPEAIPLAAIAVTAFSRRLDNVGFYERERRGIGSFLNRQQIEAARVQFSSDLLRKVPGVRLLTNTARRDAPRSFTIGRGNCRFRFVVDGTRMLPDFELDNLPVNHIEGIEVYAGMSQVPAAFRAVADATGASCGVIAVWMRDGR